MPSSPARGAGLGRLYAIELARRGASVVVNDLGGTMHGEAIVQTATQSFGRLDALVSNAGIFNSTPFDELTPDDWRRICASISTVASSSRSRHTG
ncbi:MAG: hypothetical protein QOJ24_4532 [Mycobacterium sp.]|nr:hypothetical protein [Mycobacterium sp.]